MERIFIMIFLFAGIIPSVFGEAFIENDQQFIGDDKSLHVVGEITNNLKVPLSQINVIITLFDENKNQILVKEVNSLVNTIMPGMKGPFELVLPSNEAKDTKSYSLNLDYELSHPKSQVIDITESELSTDNHNNLIITGIVKNNGYITANTVAIIATLYDIEGNVAGVSRIHPEPDYLGVNDNTFFLVTIPDKIQNEQIKEYTLVAESEEYAAVPEFPIGTLVLLVVTLSVYVGVTRHSGKIITNLISATNLKS